MATAAQSPPVTSSPTHDLVALLGPDRYRRYHLKLAALLKSLPNGGRVVVEIDVRSDGTVTAIHAGSREAV